MSDFNCLDVRPYQLMCLICRGPEMGGDARLAALRDAIHKEPDRPLRLRCRCSGVYRFQNPARDDDTPEGRLFNELRDLTILQRLGLVPGDMRPAREVLTRIIETVHTTDGICSFGANGPLARRGCARAAGRAYEEGRQRGLADIIPPRPLDERSEAKRNSAASVLAAGALRIRPHHLMCMACFHGGGEAIAPIAADNLQEAIVAIQRNPQIPVTLVEGCCMICPPCAQYDPATGLCVGGGAMSLRDQKKDLDVLRRFGLAYGDTLPASELFALLFEVVRTTTEICGNGTGVETAPEWRVCGGAKGSAGYVKARACGMGIVPPRTD
jgi:hypothetical protein